MSRTGLFESELKSHRDELTKQTKNGQKEIAAALAGAELALEKALERALESDRRMDEILGIVAEKGLVTKFAAAAERERESTKYWRIAGAVVAAGAIAAAIVTAAHGTTSDGSWRPLVSRLTVTVIVGALAAYCGSVANDHRKAEQSAERTALQLAAIKPYLTDMTDIATRDEVLAGVATRLFAQGVSSGDEIGSVAAPGVTGQLSDAVIDRIAKALAARLQG